MNSRSSELTVTAQFVRAIAKTLDISLDTIDLLLNSRRADERLPLDVVDSIWEYFSDQCEDEIFGLRAGLSISIGDLDVVGFLLSSSKTFGRSIEDMIKHHSIVSETAHFSFTSSNNDCSFNYIPHYERARRHRVEASIASTIKFAKWLTGGKFTPLSVSFSHSPPAASCVSEAEKLLGCEITYNERVDATHFDRKQLLLPIKNNNALVHERMLVLANEVMEKLPSSSFSKSVSGLVRQYPSYNKNEIAKKLFISGRHLNRKLAVEGMSFKQIQNEIRLQLATSWLKSNVHVREIVERFSFCDERSFSKAFKRWSGETPAQFLFSSKQ